MSTHAPRFAFRAIEMHGDRMWSWRWAKQAIDTASALGMNALVLHRNDMLDRLAFPERYFTVAEIWARWPVRYHNIDNNRQYLRLIAGYAADRGISLLLEIKEISFHESLLAARPELWSGTGICASDPFWWEFVAAKIEETFDAVPAISGVIVSPATRETRVTIAANACTCSRCRATSARTWYRALIGAMHGPLASRGRTLAVRDFSYTRETQSQVLAAVSEVSPDIVISLKNTPHDYYPTFPHNPRIGAVGDHLQWVEFDVWGQFYGLGVFPSIILEDLKSRLAHAAASNVSGVIARTDWEVISDASVFDTLNLANLTGFCRLCHDKNADPATLLDEVLDGPIATAFGGGIAAARFDLTAYPAARAALFRALLDSWEVMRRTVFVQRHVFHEDCMFPDTLNKAFMMFVDIHDLAEWDEAAAGGIKLDEGGLAAILAEKDEALALAHSLAEPLAGEAAALPEPARTQLAETADLWLWYVRGFRAVARACFTTARWRETRDAEARAAALAETAALIEFGAQLSQRLVATRFAYLVYWMLDTNRLTSLSADLQAILNPSAR